MLRFARANYDEEEACFHELSLVLADFYAVRPAVAALLRPPASPHTPSGAAPEEDDPEPTQVAAYDPTALSPVDSP